MKKAYGKHVHPHAAPPDGGARARVRRRAEPDLRDAGSANDLGGRPLPGLAPEHEAQRGAGLGATSSPRSRRPVSSPSSSIVQVKRVRPPGGASPLGRGPPWTNSVGRERTTSARRASPSPSRRQLWGEAGHDNRRVLDRVDERGRIGVDELRHGVDPDRPLDGDRGVGEQTAGVPPTLARLRSRPDESERDPRCSRRARPPARAPPSRARRRRRDADAVAAIPSRLPTR